VQARGVKFAFSLSSLGCFPSKPRDAYIIPQILAQLLTVALALFSSSFFFSCFLSFPPFFSFSFLLPPSFSLSLSLDGIQRGLNGGGAYQIQKHIRLPNPVAHVTAAVCVPGCKASSRCGQDRVCLRLYLHEDPTRRVRLCLCAVWDFQAKGTSPSGLPGLLGQASESDIVPRIYQVVCMLVCLSVPSLMHRQAMPAFGLRV
jgi:hypothetical protein